MLSVGTSMTSPLGIGNVAHSNPSHWTHPSEIASNNEATLAAIRNGVGDRTIHPYKSFLVREEDGVLVQQSGLAARNQAETDFNQFLTAREPPLVSPS